MMGKLVIFALAFVGLGIIVLISHPLVLMMKVIIGILLFFILLVVFGTIIVNHLDDKLVNYIEEKEDANN